MPLNPLIIGYTEKEKLSKLKEFAEAHPLSYGDLLDTYNGKKAAVGDDPRFVCYIPAKYRVVFSIEEQRKGQMRHCSISVVAKGKLPNPFACNELIKLLGFKNEINIENPCKELQVWIEEERSINIAEFI